MNFNAVINVTLETEWDVQSASSNDYVTTEAMQIWAFTAASGKQTSNPANGFTSSAATRRWTAGLRAPNTARAREASYGLGNKCTARAILPWLQALLNWEGAPKGVMNTQKTRGRQEDFKQYPTEVTQETAVTKKKWEWKLFKRYFN